MPDIFVSYSRRDAPIAQYVIRELEERGGTICAESPENCDEFLLIYSPRATESTRVAAEIAGALRAGKLITALIVAPVRPNAFLMLLDQNIITLHATQPEDVPAALNTLSEYFDITSRETAPPEAALFQPLEANPHAGDDQLTPFSAAEQENLFFLASELRQTYPGAAHTLYHALLHAAPDYGGGSLVPFVRQQAEALRDIKAKQYFDRCGEAIASGDLEAVTRVVRTMQAFAPNHPSTQGASGLLNHTRLERLWEEIQGLARELRWDVTTVTEIVERMRAIDPQDARTRRALKMQEDIKTSTALYEQADRALSAGRMDAFVSLMETLSNLYPEFGDSRGLMRNSPIQPAFARFIVPANELRDHTGAIRLLTYSPDGTLLVSGGADGTLRLWDTAENQRVAVLRRPDRVQYSARFSSDGTAMVSTAGSRFVRVWSMPEGREAIVLDEFDSDVTHALFTPDGANLICGYTNGNIEVLELQTGRVISAFQAHQFAINSMALTPDGSKLLTISDDPVFKIWPLNPDGIPDSRPMFQLAHHTMMLNDLAVSPDGSSAITVSNDEQLVIWDLNEGTRLHTLKRPTQLRSAAYSPVAPLIACGGINGSIDLIHAQTGEVVWALESHSRSVNALAFSPDGTTLVSGGSDHAVIKTWKLG